jgi:glycosyltransferase involved in cell wall biosynthesis
VKMVRDALNIREIHLFEPSGYAGVFQHSCQLAKALSRRGYGVVLHTGHEHEEVDVGGAAICACSWWPRSDRGEERSTVRRAAIARRLVRRTLPHLVGAVPPRGVLHLQGIAPGGGLNLLMLAALRVARRRVVYSPHDLFSRRGPVDGALLGIALRMPHVIIVYSHADEKRLRVRTRGVRYSPLIQFLPTTSGEERQNWRREWQVSRDDKVVLFAGFIRPEKRLDLLVESARRWPPGRRLAVVGPDRGGWKRCGQLADQYDLDIATRLKYVDIGEFTAAIAAADVVVVPSERASQSGVLAVARQLCTPTVAADIGGMAELASRTFAAGNVDDLNRAIDAELSNGHYRAQPVDESDQAVCVHLRAYEGSA